MGRNEKTKRLKPKAIEIACKSCSHMFFCPATVVSTKKPPSTRPKTRETRRKSLNKCSNRFKFKCYYSSPNSRCTLNDSPHQSAFPTAHSLIKDLACLEWSSQYDVSESAEAWRIIEGQGDGSNPQGSRQNCPSWSQAPTSCPDRDIRAFRCQLWERWTSHYHLQIPSSWSVFDNVDWMQDGSFQLASTDSEVFGRNSSGSSGSPPDSPRVSSRPAYSKIAITCRGENLARPRGRSQWNMFATMVPDKFDWKYQTDERALRRDRVRHTGYVDLNQPARNHDIWPQNSFPAVISHWESLHMELLPAVHELSWPRMMGRWLATVVETEMFPALCDHQAIWPRCLMKDQPVPIVDYICRATPQSIGWRKDMCPVLFAAQYDMHPKSSRCDPHSVAGKLASVFQSTMAILILYYLDTRVSTDDPMPAWMILFGIHYNESGFVIRQHSPHFQPSTQFSSDAKSGWRANSSIINAAHRWDLLKLPEHRGALLTTLNRIQGHCAHVLHRLKAWDGYERACQLLMV